MERLDRQERELHGSFSLLCMVSMLVPPSLPPGGTADKLRLCEGRADRAGLLGFAK